MTMLLIIFGVLILLVGLVIMINPELIFGFLRRYYTKPVVHVLAVVVRFALGMLLVGQAALSKYPAAISVLGWLAIIVALILAVMGRQNFLKLMAWALNELKAFGRLGGMFAAVFGGFLVYAFV